MVVCAAFHIKTALGIVQRVFGGGLAREGNDSIDYSNI